MGVGVRGRRLRRAGLAQTAQVKFPVLLPIRSGDELFQAVDLVQVGIFVLGIHLVGVVVGLAAQALEKGGQNALRLGEFHDAAIAAVGTRLLLVGSFVLRVVLGRFVRLVRRLFLVFRLLLVLRGIVSRFVSVLLPRRLRLFFRFVRLFFRLRLFGCAGEGNYLVPAVPAVPFWPDGDAPGPGGGVSAELGQDIVQGKAAAVRVADQRFDLPQVAIIQFFVLAVTHGCSSLAPWGGLVSGTLAHRLIQQHGGGGRGVQGVDLAEHGDGHGEVAVLRHQAAHAVPLAADDNGGRAF